MQVDEAAVSHGNSGHCNSETSANVDRSIQQNSVHCKFDTAKQDEAILVLYIFSGKSRKGSVSHWCSKLSKRHSRAVKVEMVDIKVKPHIDLTQKSNRDKILQKMKDEGQELQCYHFFSTVFNVQSGSMVKPKRSQASSFLCATKGTHEAQLD